MKGMTVDGSNTRLYPHRAHLEHDVMRWQGGLQRRTQSRRVNTPTHARPNLNGWCGSIFSAFEQQSVRCEASVEDTMASDDRPGRHLCERGHRVGDGLSRGPAFCIGLEGLVGVWVNCGHGCGWGVDRLEVELKTGKAANDGLQ